MSKNHTLLYILSAVSFVAAWWIAALFAAGGGYANILPSPATAGAVALDLFKEG